jgi:hypothetical protein
MSGSAPNPKSVQTGTAGGVAINTDMSRLESSVPVRVQLSASYATLHNPGDPTRPDFTGCAASNLDFPKTVANGTIIHLLAGEAAALVAAGKAAYV